MRGSNSVTLIAEYYRIQVELPNTTYKVPNTNISLKIKLVFWFRTINYIYKLYKNVLFKIYLTSYCCCFPCFA